MNNNNSTECFYITGMCPVSSLNYSDDNWTITTSGKKYEYDNPISEEPPEKELSKSKLPQSFDARDWVNEWRETLKTAPTISWDNDTMLTWFSNALMAGFDEAHRREQGKEKYVYILRSSQHSGVIATYSELPSKEVCDRDYSLYLGKDLSCIGGSDIPIAGQGSDWNCVLEKWKLDSTNRIHENVKIEYK
jgi:hypothetical protein